MCDVETSTVLNMAYRIISDKLLRGGRRYVAGGPNVVSCANSQHTEGISMHLFPIKKKQIPKDEGNG